MWILGKKEILAEIQKIAQLIDSITCEKNYEITYKVFY